MGLLQGARKILLIGVWRLYQPGSIKNSIFVGIKMEPSNENLDISVDQLLSLMQMMLSGDNARIEQASAFIR